MKKFVIALFAAVIACFAVMAPAQAHCVAWDPVFGTCVMTMPDVNPPTGWSYCANPGSPAAGAIQLFTVGNFSGYCIETTLKNSVVNDFRPFDWVVRSVKSRKSTEGGLASQRLFSGTNQTGTAWTIPYGDTASLPITPASMNLWHF